MSEIIIREKKHILFLGLQSGVFPAITVCQASRVRSPNENFLHAHDTQKQYETDQK